MTLVAWRGWVLWKAQGNALYCSNAGSWAAGAGLLEAGVPSKTMHRHMRQIRFARVIYNHTSRLNTNQSSWSHIIWQKATQRAGLISKCWLLTCCRCVCVSTAPVSGRLHPFSQCTSASTTENKTPKHRYLPQKVTECDLASPSAEQSEWCYTPSNSSHNTKMEKIKSMYIFLSYTWSIECSHWLITSKTTSVHF